MVIRARILFTDPSKTFAYQDESLKEGILNLIRKARHSISIHGYSLAGFFTGDIFDRDLVSSLKKGVKLTVHGNNDDEIRLIKSVFSQYNPLCYRWAPPPPNDNSIYHIKAIVIDERYLYIGSANMSRKALDSNSEVGLILEDNQLASEVTRYSKHLVEQGFLLEV